MVAAFIVISIAVIAITIAALIVNADFGKALSYAGCNVQNAVDEGYGGSSSPSPPWVGINNLQSQMEQFGSTMSNYVPVLTNYFSSSNLNFNTIIDVSNGSIYNNSQSFEC
jgi:hypothetical protein